MASNSHGDLPIGSEVSGYRVDGVIGRGGMGVVYRATQLALARTVALKLLAPELTRDAEFRERFKRESKVAAALDHPSVVPIYEAGEHEDGLFIAMRYVDGLDLGGCIEHDGPLEPRRAALIVSQIADALDAAHQRGLVHRDIKPGNILLAAEGSREHAYLADFGLIKESSSAANLTRTGVFVGTLNYIAPEQLRGEPVDARTDLYALGCVLYQCLTARPPFEADSEVAVMYAHLSHEPPHPTSIRPGLPAAFDAVIARALAKEPAERFQSGGELAHAATMAVEGEAPPAPAPAAPAAVVPPAPSGVSGAEAAPGSAPPTVTGTPVPPPATVAPPPPVTAPTPPRRRRRSRRRRRREAVEGLGPGDGTPLRIPLTPSFRFTHEPLQEDNVIPLLGNGDLVDSLASRIEHSSGGSVLITGFRGVGKTTIVLRTLAAIAARADGVTLIPVVINVARPRPLPELLFEIIRKLYEQLEDSGVIDDLDPAFKTKLQTAYERTSRSIKEIKTNVRERGGGMSLGVTAPGVGGAPALSVSRRLSDSSGVEAEFMAYSESDVEQDFSRFVGLLRRGVKGDGSKGWRARLFRREASPEAWRGQVIVVIDELDKLTEVPGGLEWIRGLLTGLKNLLTVEGVHFIFVGGHDLREEAIEDAMGGNSVFESVFSWQEYVPCVWDAEDNLLDALIGDAAAYRAPQLEHVRDHLAFWGRGVPRLLLRELNRLANWGGSEPCLNLSPRQQAEAELYAGLQRLVREFIAENADEELDPVELDRWRLGVYYVVDWILRFQVTFTAEDLMVLSSGQELDPLLALSEEEVADLLEHLEARGIVHQVGGQLVGETFYGDVPEAQTPAYEVSKRFEWAVGAHEEPSAPADADEEPIGPVETPAGGTPFAGALGRTLHDGRYELIAELDRGGTGHVYRARDTASGAEVAIKVFDLPGLRENDRMRTRFAREGEIALELHHPHIVKAHDAFTEPDGTLAIVTDLVTGVSLADRLRQGPLDPADALAVATRILEALAYLNAKGIARLDLRPSGIMIDEALSPTLTKLGLAKYVTAHADNGATQAGAILGTPAYAAPEQLRGEAVDIRCDLYSLGLILFEMLTGRAARDADSVSAAIDMALNRDVELGELAVSLELRQALARALARDPAARFREPAEMRAALVTVPENAHR